MFIDFIKRVVERDKMPGISSIYLFLQQFNKFNSTCTRAGMLDVIKIILNLNILRETVILLSLCMQCFLWTSQPIPKNM